MTPPRILAITPPSPGPWLSLLPTLPAQGVDGLLIRLIDAPRALPEVLAATPPELTVLLRPVLPSDPERAISEGLALHLPSQMNPGDWRARHPGLLSVACHGRTELDRAAAAGADMALLSPVFSPISKPGDTRPTLGVQGFIALAATTPMPVLALGGITPTRAATIRAAGGYGVAGISTFFPASPR